MTVRDIYSSDILLVGKKCENILIHVISYKMGLWIQNHCGLSLINGLSSIDGFIKIYDGIRYLVLFGYWYYDEIFDNLKYPISEKSQIADNINYNLEESKMIHIILYP